MLTHQTLLFALVAALFCVPVSASAQQLAMPRGDPQSWLQPADFPEAAGSITVTLTVRPTGQVEACEVIETSGSTALDGEICAKLRRRGRFQPALDANGQVSVGAWRHRYTWPKPD